MAGSSGRCSEQWRIRSLCVKWIWCCATLRDVVNVFHEIGSEALYSVNVPPSTGLHGPVHPGTDAVDADGVAVPAVVDATGDPTAFVADAAAVGAVVATAALVAVGAAVGVAAPPPHAERTIRPDNAAAKMAAPRFLDKPNIEIPPNN